MTRTVFEGTLRGDIFSDADEDEALSAQRAGVAAGVFDPAPSAMAPGELFQAELDDVKTTVQVLKLELVLARLQSEKMQAAIAIARRACKAGSSQELYEVVHELNVALKALDSLANESSAEKNDETNNS